MRVPVPEVQKQDQVGRTPEVYVRTALADPHHSPRQWPTRIAPQKPAPPDAMLTSPAGPAAGTPGNQQAGQAVLDPDEAEIEIVRAKTMHQMVDSIADGPNDFKKIIYLTNLQANVISSELQNVVKLLDAFELPPSCKLVIRFLPVSGGSHMIDNGMLSAFRALKRDQNYAQEWRKLLRRQAQSVPGFGQEVLPIPPFLNEVDDQAEAEWGIESFMRDVLVPLAAETNALVVGSAFKDDTMMMLFSKVADSLDAKFGSVGQSPWQMFGFADAPSLAMACCDPTTTAFAYFKACRTWQEKYSRILVAKHMSKPGARTDDFPSVSEDDIESLLKKFDVDEIQYDINQNITNLVIVGGVEVNRGQTPELRINTSPQLLLESMVTNHLVRTKACVGIATMHARGGHQGLMRLSKWLNMSVPVLLIDIRERKSYAKQSLSTPGETSGDAQSSGDPNFHDGLKREKKKREIQGIRKLFVEMREKDLEFVEAMEKEGKADIYDLCRLAHFHSMLLMPRKVESTKNMSLHAAIQNEFDASQTFTDDETVQMWEQLQSEIVEYLVDREFATYWQLKPAEEKDELAAELANCTQNADDTEEPWRRHFHDQMVEARTAVYAVLSDTRTFSAHVCDIPKMSYILQQKMMDMDFIPDANSMEGLGILRSAWDVVDIAHHVLQWYKLSAKVLNLLVIIFAVVHPTVVVFQADIDAALSVTLAESTSMTGSQFIIFIVSTITALVTAIMSFYRPHRRWQQIRDAEMTMRTAIWQYRTRTGAYQCANSEDSQVANVSLREQVLICRTKILGSSDMQGTSFYKQYPAKVYRHGQRGAQEGKSKSGTKVAPRLDLESLESRYIGEDDDHHRPIGPDEYIRLRLYSIMAFYRERLPKYSVFWERSQFLVMAGAVIRFAEPSFPRPISVYGYNIVSVVSVCCYLSHVGHALT